MLMTGEYFPSVPDTDSPEAATAHIDLTGAEQTTPSAAAPGQEIANLRQQLEEAQTRARDLAQMLVESTTQTDEIKEVNKTLRSENEGHLRVIKWLQERLMTDTLTNIPNRESFFQELERRETLGLPFALANIDLDNFKTINDRYGHDYGDITLQRASELIVLALSETGTRADDFVARLSGDEFAIILDMQPHEDTTLTPDERAEAAGKNIVEKIASYAQYAALDQFGFKASIGVAVHEVGTEVEATMRLADQRMYENKRQHRTSNESQGS
jgi:diguanylate cyclase (GGDEF)-like protein